MAQEPEPTSRVGVRDVLGLPGLTGAELLGGAPALDRRLSRVRLVPHTWTGAADLSGAAYVLDGHRLHRDTFVVDTTLRRMEEAGAALLVVVAPAQPIGLSAGRLADKLGLALVRIDGDVLEVADGMRDLVEAPLRTVARLLLEALDAVARTGPGIADVLGTLDRALAARSSLVGSEGEVVAGAPLDPPVPGRDRLAVPVRSTTGTGTLVVQPVPPARGEQPAFWLVLTDDSGSSTNAELLTRIAGPAAAQLATRLLSDRLERERDARARIGALNSILAVGERPSAELVGQLGLLGWSTDGWCTALHLRIAGPVERVDPARIPVLTDALASVLERVFPGPLIERPDGWSSWTTTPTEPPATSYRLLVTDLRRALQEFVTGRDGLRVHAGIGRPYAGVVGLRQSLAESREAATVAQATGSRTAVQHVDELGVQRILVGWYTSDEFGDFARTLLRPITAIDPGEDLLRTLAVHLDNESSPTATADVLGVHRNTVINRIARIRQALQVDLDDPDQRLAVQLACRVVGLGG
ncbi:hypothetical protein GIS00_02975 [Nakamurella sp. YIM 132087]|uniref:PucR family transcriptional regulator n=1 Tax=Nakamurella alba TaxID=2665158 RepID=A0A7K1FFM5_9ACTN|nr:helix-turn-helix domain-containing protein [Nakamurella alba]MTD12908.1 hypothetical protein [Nakamurella alba]